MAIAGRQVRLLSSSNHSLTLSQHLCIEPESHHEKLTFYFYLTFPFLRIRFIRPYSYVRRHDVPGVLNISYVGVFVMHLIPDAITIMIVSCFSWAVDNIPILGFFPPCELTTRIISIGMNENANGMCG